MFSLTGIANLVLAQSLASSGANSTNASSNSAATATNVSPAAAPEVTSDVFYDVMSEDDFEVGRADPDDNDADDYYDAADDAFFFGSADIPPGFADSPFILTAEDIYVSDEADSVGAGAGGEDDDSFFTGLASPSSAAAEEADTFFRGNGEHLGAYVFPSPVLSEDISLSSAASVTSVTSGSSVCSFSEPRFGSFSAADVVDDPMIVDPFPPCVARVFARLFGAGRSTRIDPSSFASSVSRLSSLRVAKKSLRVSRSCVRAGVRSLRVARFVGAGRGGRGGRGGLVRRRRVRHVAVRSKKSSPSLSSSSLFCFGAATCPPWRVTPLPSLKVRSRFVSVVAACKQVVKPKMSAAHIGKTRGGRVNKFQYAARVRKSKVGATHRGASTIQPMDCSW